MRAQHPPRLNWVILSSFLFKRFDVFYFPLCQGSFALKVFSTNLTPDMCRLKWHSRLKSLSERGSSLAEGAWAPFADEFYDSSSRPGKSK